MSQTPIYYLDTNEYGVHPSGTYIVNQSQSGAQIQKVLWNSNSNEWDMEQGYYGAPIGITPLIAQDIINNEPIHTHQSAPAYFTTDETVMERFGHLPVKLWLLVRLMQTVLQ